MPLWSMSLVASQLTISIELTAQATIGLTEHTSALPAVPILPARLALTMIMSSLARVQEVVLWQQGLQLPVTRFCSSTLVMTRAMPLFNKFLQCSCSLSNWKTRNGIISFSTTKTWIVRKKIRR